MLCSRDLQSLFVCNTLLCNRLKLISLELRLLQQTLVCVLDGSDSSDKLLVALCLSHQFAIQVLTAPFCRAQRLQHITASQSQILAG